MKKKLLMYGILPAFAVAVLGVNQASAHGWFGMLGNNNATPDEIAQNQTNLFQREADLLGISLDAVKQGWSEGKTFAQIAQDNGINQTDLQNKMKAQAKQKLADRLKALVDKGIITQAQADQRLKFEQQLIDNGNGMNKGFRGFHAKGLFENNNSMQ
jgi:hypothetical protein